MKQGDNCGFLYLVRHCATANDERNYPKLLGREIPQWLSASGQKQAALLEQHFAKRNISAIYTSSQSAAVQTARAIRGTTGKLLTFCTSLTEADFGTWEGSTEEQIVRTPQHPAFMAGVGFPDGETFKQVSARVLGYIEQLVKAHSHKRIVIVSHEWALRTVICELCKQPFDRIRDIEQGIGHVTLLRVFKGQLEVRAANFDLTNSEDSETCDLSSMSLQRLQQ